MARPRVAWFSPLQPVESGISLYSEEILPILASVVDIDAIVDNYRPTELQESASLRVRCVRDFNPSDYDLIIYQVGNSPVHLYMLPEIKRAPGLLVLHDTMVNHLFVQQAARDGTLLDYRSEMVRRYGEKGGAAADRVLKGQSPDDLFLFPMSEQLVDASTTTMVHSEYARQQVLNRSPDATVARVPHGLRLPENLERSTARKRLGIPDDQFVIASISHINPHKRINVVLRALKSLRQSVPARLILAGSVSRNFPLNRMINHLGLDQVVDVPGYVSDKEARLIAAAADVIVNLRYPTAGETSGSLLHSMAAGRPVLISETGSFTEVPGNAAIRIPVDSLEESMLAVVLQRLAADPDLGDAIGRNAREFIGREHSLQKWADGYRALIEQHTGNSIDAPIVDECPEPVDVTEHTTSQPEPDLLTASIARDIAELGLGGDDSLLAEVAAGRTELGLGVGMISQDTDAVDESGGRNDRSEPRTDQ